MSAVSKESEDEAEAAGTSSMMESTMMEGEEYYNPDPTVAWSEKVAGGEQLCRICAGANEYLIPIFSGEGLEHQLGMKIEKHLPIQVLEQDKLPVQVCYQCASTLIAWHDLVVGCVEAEKKLQQLYQQENAEEEEEEDDFGDDDRTELFNDPVDSEMAEDPLEPSTSTSTATRSTRSPRKKTVTRAKPKLKMTLVKTPAALPKSPPKLLQPKEEQVEADPATERSSSLRSFSTFLEEQAELKRNIISTVHHLCDYQVKVVDENEPFGDEEGESSYDDFVIPDEFEHRALRWKKKKRKKELSCEMCSEFFTRRSALARHKRVVHGWGVKTRREASEGAVLGWGVKERREATESESEGTDEGGSDRSAGTDKINEKPLKKKRKSRLTDAQLAAVSQAKVTVGDRTLFHCNQCGKNIMHQFSYLTHLRIHTGEKPFTCHVCGRQFRTASQLVRHVNDVHEGIKRHPCDVCGRMFAHARARNEHRRTHTEERPCVCHVCGKAFKTKASLYVHNTFHTDVFKHQCPHCERQFRRRQELNDHVMIHTGEKPFACEVCGKSFRQRQELKRHLLTHSSEKPFECPTCKQCFSQKRYLRNHAKTHGI